MPNNPAHWDGAEEYMERLRDEEFDHGEAEMLDQQKVYVSAPNWLIQNYIKPLERSKRRISDLEEQYEAAMDCMNYAWTIICNVSEGDWTKQQQEWQDAAARCREQYHALLDSNPASGSDDG